MRQLFAFLPLVAWVWSLSLRLCASPILARIGHDILLPMVSAPRSSAGDVVSSVNGLMLVMGWATVAVVLIEPTKIAALRGKGPRKAYFVILLTQACVYADTIRSHAFDWWLWLWALGPRDSDAVVTLDQISGFRFPWFSLIVATLSTALLCKRDTQKLNDSNRLASSAP